MLLKYLLLFAIIFTSIFLSINKKKLTTLAAFGGGLIAFFIFFGAGFTGVFMLGAFFFMATFATAFKINLKQQMKVAEKSGGKRTINQVIANGGMAGILGLIGGFYPAKNSLLTLMMAASLSAATSDTLSSELGTLYGKRFYNIINLKNGNRGENGVVSLEGLLIGIAGSIIIAFIYAIGFGFNLNFFVIIIGGTIGNIVDSILGATLEKKQCLNNDEVNFINTIFAAMCAWFCASFLNYL